MTEDQLRRTRLPYLVRFENKEGDGYKVYDVSLSETVHLKCVLDTKNSVTRILISSAGVKDQHGLGVGAHLGELKRAYPAGKFVYGDADGFYANFLTDERLVYYFNPRDLSVACFDDEPGCKVDDSIQATTIAIGATAN